MNSSMIGPIVRRAEYYRLVVDGYLVPYVEVSANPDGSWEVKLDGRMCIDVQDRTEIDRWAWLLANAMAVAAGYQCIGQTQKRGPFATQVADIEAPAGSPERGVPKVRLVPPAGGSEAGE